MNPDRRSWSLLVLIAVLPLFLFLSFYAAFHAQNRQRSIERNAHADADLVAARADGLVREALATSRALAATAAIADPDIRLAQSRAERFLQDNPAWVEVALDDNGRKVALFDLGRRASRVGPFLQPGEIATDLRLDQACRCVVISRGLAAAGGGARTLHIAIATEPFFRLLPRAYGNYEVSALADERGHFIARSIDNDGRFGTPASIYLRRAATSPARRGVYRGTSLEGTSTYTAFTRLEVNSWSAHIALKAQRIDNPGLAFWISIAIAALLSLLLALLLYLVARRQIDNTRLLTQRIQEAQKMEALGQLTGGMAHDFNNLLTPIVGALDRLTRSDNLDAREKRFAIGAFESAERAASLTAQLLSFSRRQKLTIGSVDVGTTLMDVAILAGQSFEGRHTIDQSVVPATPPVATDKIQLELALLNLILNARDAMPDGGKVTLRAAPVRDGGRAAVAFSVADTGSGMDAETSRRALEPFFTTKPQGAGTGLGLPQVAEVARQSGGRLMIDSAPGRGTTVRLILPAADAIPAAAAAPSWRSRNRTGSLKLLIVDDNADVRETIVQMVEAEGHRVESVADGRTGLVALTNRKPDLVLVDFAMPGLNGAEFLAEANRIHPNLPCLMITGYWDSDALTDSGVACPILRKPFTAEALRDAMAEALAMHQR